MGWSHTWISFDECSLGKHYRRGSCSGVTPVGGVVLQKKPSASGSYPAYTPCDSNRGWHGEWFYIRNPAEVPFLPFTGRRLERQESWSWGPASWPKKKVEIIEVEL